MAKVIGYICQFAKRLVLSPPLLSSRGLAENWKETNQVVTKMSPPSTGGGGEEEGVGWMTGNEVNGLMVTLCSVSFVPWHPLWHTGSGDDCDIALLAY